MYLSNLARPNARQMTSSELRSRLDDLVWGASIDPYTDALDAYYEIPWHQRHALGAVRDWAMEQYGDCQQKCATLSKKCDMGHPGVRAIYEHYFNLKGRYWLVYEAIANAR